MSKALLPQEIQWPEHAVFTLGHSTLPIEDFLSLLQAYDIRQLIDVRTIPRSRHNPQFNAEHLQEALPAQRIEYRVMRDLGGLRHAHRDSPNGGWRNASFRGYADYMQTERFEEAIKDLIRLSRQKRTAIMCAEAVPWRCHRSLIADALMIRDIPVVEILSERQYRMHALTSFAVVDGVHVTYPPQQQSLL